MMGENSSPIYGEKQQFWKHLSKFSPRRSSCCAFGQTALTPTCKKSGKVAPPPEKYFSTRIIIVVFSFHFLMSKIELFGNLGRDFFEISAHKYQQPSILLRIMPASHPVSGCILSATLLCKKPGQVTPLPENLC